MGVNKDNVTYITLQDHVNAAIDILDSVGEPAIVVGHSYGGVVLSEVAEARPELVKAAVYLSAFMLQNNQSLLEARKGNPTPAPADSAIFSFNSQGIPISFTYNMSYFESLLCEGCSQTDVSLANSLFVAQPLSTWETPITIGANYESVKKVYISALQDKSIPPVLQESMYSQFPDTEVFKIESPHMVPLYDPEGLAKILNSLAE
jgi:pimeloyl-ACP methyl ester carboxylesterase